MATKSLETWARKHDVNVYVKNAGPTMQGLLQKAAELDRRRLDLSSEIDLARAITMQCVSHLSAIVERTKDDPDAVSLATRILCEKLVREAVESVASLVSTAARIKSNEEGTITLKAMGWVIGEITRVIEEEVRVASPVLADRITERIRTLPMPVDPEVLGTLQIASASEEFL